MGQALGISEFLLVKWIAPSASEAPELLVAALFAWRLAARTGFGALISSKVNQWTLARRNPAHRFLHLLGDPPRSASGTVQRVELMVTAAQSVFAVAIVASRSVSTKEAWVMLSLFIFQLLESGLTELGHISEEASAQARIGVGIVFLLAAVWVLRKDVRTLSRVVKDGLRTPWDQLVEE